jgi:hypothetical protein
MCQVLASGNENGNDVCHIQAKATKKKVCVLHSILQFHQLETEEFKALGNAEVMTEGTWVPEKLSTTQTNI